MITAYEALLLPSCMAVLLGLLLGFGLDSLIQVCGLLFLKSSTFKGDGARGIVAVRGRVGEFSDAAGCEERTV